MILTRKRLLVDIFLTCRLSKSLAFYEFASINFEPCSRETKDVLLKEIQKLISESQRIEKTEDLTKDHIQ